jgi:hypothetical protein
MTEADSIWARVKETATALGVRGQVVSLADARFAVLAICREQRVDLSPAYAVEYLASELVRLNLESYNVTQRRLNLKAAI